MVVMLTNYLFDALNGEIVFPTQGSLIKERLLLIVNQTRGVIVFDPSTPGKQATLSGNVITLDFDTTTFADSDTLQIFYDDGESPAKEQGNLLDSTQVLQEMFLLLADFTRKLDVYSDGGGRLQVALTSPVTQGNLSFCTSVQNLASVNGLAGGAINTFELYRLPTNQLENDFYRLVEVS